MSLKASSEWKKRNREAMTEYRKQWMKEHPEKKNEYEKRYRDTHKDELNKQRRQFRKNNPGYGREYAKRVRKEVLEKYGNKCVCCGETTFEFLSFDHMKGRGIVHREKIQETGQKFMFWLRKHRKQKFIQILCHNCNQALGHYGACPHRPEIQREVVRRKR